MNALKFFQAIFQGCRGWAVLCTFPGGRYNRSSGPTEMYWFRYPEQSGDMMAMVLKHKRDDLYVVPTLYSSNRSRRAVNAKVGACIYADADDCNPAKFRVPPTLVVETSPDRYQAYWVLRTDDPQVREATPEQLSAIGRRIARAHAEDGCDPSGWDLGQLLRVPGTTNNKPSLDVPWSVQAEVYSDALYSLARMDEAYPPVQGEGEGLLGEVPELPDELPDFDEVYSKVANDPDIADMLDPTDDVRDRSTLMWRFLNEMVRIGLKPEEVLVLGWGASYNKYRIDKRPMAEFWKEVCRAFAESGTDMGTSVPEEGDEEEEPQEPDGWEWEQLPHGLDRRSEESWQKLSDLYGEELAQLGAEAVGDSPPGGLKFLDPEEVGSVPVDTFVDVYLDWAMDKTDAATPYHRAAAMLILSTVFGDFAYPATKFPLGGLNLWFMILGGTTRSRKTTVRHMMLNVLNALNDNVQYEYDLGSDVTAEGLTVELADRSGRSLIFTRDEAHGFLGETGAKNYLSGLKETLTELYDGRVRGRIRAATGRTKGGTTAFNMWLSGVTDDVAERLTPKDFGSGFLARFLYAYAPAPERTPESVRMEQMEHTDPTTIIVDEVMETKIVAPLARSRQFWETLTKPGHQVPMSYTEDAWERINRFAWDVGTAAEKSLHKEVLEPTVDRLAKSVVKAGILLAMYEQCTQAEMGHALRAIALAEEWYVHLELMAGKVKDGDWARQLDSVREVLTLYGEQVKYQTVYKEMSRVYRPKEFEELIKALVSAGEVRIAHAKGVKVIEKVG